MTVLWLAYFFWYSTIFAIPNLSLYTKKAVGLEPGGNGRVAYSPSALAPKPYPAIFWANSTSATGPGRP